MIDDERCAALETRIRLGDKAALEEARELAFKVSGLPKEFVAFIIDKCLGEGLRPFIGRADTGRTRALMLAALENVIRPLGGRVVVFAEHAVTVEYGEDPSFLFNWPLGR